MITISDLLLLLRKRDYRKVNKRPVRWLSSRKMLVLGLESPVESRTHHILGQFPKGPCLTDLKMNEDTGSFPKVQLLVLFQLAAGIQKCKIHFFKNLNQPPTQTHNW